MTFSYDGQVNILEHFNLNVQPGESIALVGPTGAGKTTVVNLISRFYNIDKGAVLLDGHDISKVTLHSLRSQMGIMLQDSFIFSGTIMDNIRYGRLDATDEEVIAAAKTVRADEFIREMEDGYYTQVNERGSRLSQGQKQLVAFARTLLSDPKILVLDEATSSIDAKTERLLQEGLNALLKGRTSFIIAHRLSTIKTATASCTSPTRASRRWAATSSCWTSTATTTTCTPPSWKTEKATKKGPPRHAGVPFSTISWARSQFFYKKMGRSPIFRQIIRRGRVC